MFYGRYNVVTLLFQWCDMQECHIRSDMSIGTTSDIVIDTFCHIPDVNNYVNMGIIRTVLLS